MMSNRAIVIEAIDLSVVRGRVPILQDVCLAVPRGAAVALMGPNGAGKSTLLKCLAGVLRPTSGTVACGAETPRQATVRGSCRIGFAGHESGLYHELTTLENLTFAARMHGVDHPQMRAQSLLAEAGIEPAAGRQVGQLSQGLRQRLAILRAVVHDPTLILLDEPFASLDARGQTWLEDRFQRWRSEERTVCFASHDIEQCHRLADRIVQLDKGRIVETECQATLVVPRRSA